MSADHGRGRPLIDTAIRKARPRAEGYRLTDGNGLYLWITPKGMKTWRYRYEWLGKDQTLSLGAYPDLGLTAARSARDEARAILRQGQNPATVKREMKPEAGRQISDTFEALAREWYDLQRETWTVRHASDVLKSLEERVFPTIGRIPIREVKAVQIVEALRKIEATAVETAHRTRQRVSAVFEFAMAMDRAERDPAAKLKIVLRPVRKKRQAAITDVIAAREILKAVDRTPSAAATKLVMRLLALTAVRPGTMTTTPWSEFDELDSQEPLWRIPAARLKMALQHKDDESRDHLVPLPRQAVEILQVLRGVTGHSPFILPNARYLLQPASPNALGYLLNRAGYSNRHVPHGWRSTFSTVMNERYPEHRAAIDLMLAHLPSGGISGSEGAYNRAAHIERRRELAQIWADLITEGLRPPNELLGLPHRVNKLRSGVTLR